MKQRQYMAGQRFRAKRSKKARRRFYDKQGRRCWYCGKGVKAKKFRLEHQVPFADGGSCRLRENIVLACEPCDTEKGRRSIEQYREFLQHKYGVSVQFYRESGRLLKLRQTA